MPNKFLPPQTTTATRTASTPIQGEIFYDTDENQLYYGDGATTGGVVVGGAGAFADLSDVDTTGLQTGQAMVWNGAVWVPGSSSSGREVLAANRTYYVRTDGNDSNDGLTDSSGGAFLTAEKALEAIRAIDGNGKVVKIKFADGTYEVSSNITWNGFIGIPILFLEGNTTNPENVIIQGGVGVSPNLGVWILEKESFDITGFKFTNTQTSGDCSTIRSGANVTLRNNVWGTASRHQIVMYSYASLEQIGNCAIDGGTGGNGRFLTASSSSANFTQAGVCTITNTPAYAEFVNASSGGIISWVSSNFSWSGSATGKQYNATTNGIIQTYGQGVNFPGNAGGSVASGGQYL